jgi:uncharacterized cupredoxin-like copper-binding protein
MKFNQMIVTLLGIVAIFNVTAGEGHEHEHGKKEKAAAHAHHQGSGHDHGQQHANTSPVGQPAEGTKATKTVKVTTKDTMRYDFDKLPPLKHGDIVKFIVTNEGKIAHEFSIGDEKEQKAHREMMRKMPNMVHEDGNTVTVGPGETRTLTWQFKGGSEAVFACNIPGHFEAGMVARMKVTDSQAHDKK